MVQPYVLYQSSRRVQGMARQDRADCIGWKRLCARPWRSTLFRLLTACIPCDFTGQRVAPLGFWVPLCGLHYAMHEYSFNLILTHLSMGCIACRLRWGSARGYVDRRENGVPWLATACSALKLRAKGCYLGALTSDGVHACVRGRHCSGKLHLLREAPVPTWSVWLIVRLLHAMHPSHSKLMHTMHGTTHDCAIKNANGDLGWEDNLTGQFFALLQSE